MSGNFVHKEYNEQIEILKSSNMYFGDETKAEYTLSVVPYYKIKEFARPLCKKSADNRNIDYQSVKFENILSRYYQDKNLRIKLFHALEDIEVALKTQVSYVLGRDGMEAHGYLNFGTWCDKEEYCKHYLKYKEEQLKRKIKQAMSNTSNVEILEKQKQNKKKYPPVWLVVDLLTFGQLIELISLMSKKNKTYLAKFYKCSNEEFMSWLKCMNFVRNTCAHNSNLIDLKIKTQPVIKNEWKPFLYQIKTNVYTDRIAVILFVISHFIKCVNQRYKTKELTDSLGKLIKKEDSTSQYFGFSDFHHFKLFTDSLNKNGLFLS